MNTTDPTKLKEFISKAFVESGEQYTLYTKTKQLLTESGWTAQVQAVCQEELQKHPQHIDPEQLTSVIYKRVQGLVPDSVKSEILKDVHKFVEKCCK